jgi:checkpoint serine/threonine-protein kinase
MVYREDKDGSVEEFSFEELRAIERGLYDIDWKARREEKRRLNAARPRIPLGGSRTPIKVKTILSPPPNKGKIKKKGRGNSSPTMTFHTKAATDEIYSIFNQPLRDSRPDRDDSDDTDFDTDSDDDYTITTQLEAIPGRPGEEGDDDDDDDAGSVRSDRSDFTRANGMIKNDVCEEDNDISVPEVVAAAINPQDSLVFKNPPHSSEQTVLLTKAPIPPPMEDFGPPTHSYHRTKEQLCAQDRLPFMTPIVEKTESLAETVTRDRVMLEAKTPSRVKKPILDDARIGGPFHGIDHDYKINRLKWDPIIDDMRCNPLDESMRSLVFQKLQPPLKSYPGYYEYPNKNSGKTAEIKKYIKTIGKRDAEKHTSSIPNKPSLEFITGDGGSSYIVKKELGKGAFAPVYLVENVDVGDTEDEAGESRDNKPLLEKMRITGRNRWEALKMEEPPSPWEFFILTTTRSRLGESRAIESIVRVHEMHLFADEGFLILEHRDQGTILDIVNFAKSEPTGGTGAGLDELVVMFFSVELLRTIEAIHANSIIHGDLKADNCMVRFDPVADNEWSSHYQRDGYNGWSKKGLILIDFGRGIDMMLFPTGVQFLAEWKTDQHDCAEMREMRPWTYQTDYHGIAAVIHLMLFGKYIVTVADKSPVIAGSSRYYKISSPLKRYWEQDIWNVLFDILLNPMKHLSQQDNQALPINSVLKSCRERMELWLIDHCDRGIGLKSMLRKLEVPLGSKRR